MQGQSRTGHETEVKDREGTGRNMRGKALTMNFENEMESKGREGQARQGTEIEGKDNYMNMLCKGVGLQSNRME